MFAIQSLILKLEITNYPRLPVTVANQMQEFPIQSNGQNCLELAVLKIGSHISYSCDEQNKWWAVYQSPKVITLL